MLLPKIRIHIWRIHKAPRKIKYALVVSSLIIFISAFIYVRFAFAATKCWDGGGTTNNWSELANWAGDSLPGAGDTATFHGGSCTAGTPDKDVTIDSAVSLTSAGGGISIGSNYSGTITQSASVTLNSGGFTQAGGTWNGGSQTLDIDNGSFSVTGGTHTATTGTWTVERSFTSSGGTLTMTGATVTIDGSASDNGDDSTLTCTGSLGGSVNVAKVYNLQSFTLGTGCSISLGTGTSTQGLITNNGTIINNNTATFYNNIDSTNGTLTNNGTISIAGDASDTNDDTTLSCTGSIGGTINISKVYVGQLFTLGTGCSISPASVSLKAPFTNNGTFTIGDGLTSTFYNTIDSTNGTLTNNGTISIAGGALDTFDDTTLSCTGSIGGTINISKVYVNQSFTLGTGCSISPASVSLKAPFTNNGTFTIGNGLTFTFYNNIDSTNGTLTNNGTISIAGDASDTFDDTTLSCTGSIGGTINISKVYNLQSFTLGTGCSISPAAVSLKGSFTNNGTFTIGNGLTFTFYNTINSANGTLTNNGTISIAGDVFEVFDDTTLSCSNAIDGQVTVSKVYNQQFFTLGSNCTVNHFTRTSGIFSNPASAYTLTIQGNFSMSTTDAFGGANLTLVMGGSATTQTMTQNAGAINNNIQINKSSGTASLSTNLTTNGTATASAGIFDINGRTFTAGQGFSVEDGATFELFGSETTTLPTLNSGSTVKYTGDGDSLVDNYTLKDLTYYHLTIASVDSGDTFATPNTTEDVDGNFTLTGGTFTAPSSTFTIGGNFTHTGGTFTHNSGTVTLDDVAQTTNVSGSTTFNNLTSVTAGKKITVANGTTQTVSNNFTLTGSAGNRISLKGVSGGSQWNLTAVTPNVSYVDARDSNACGGTSVSAVNSVDLGNNSCWSFSQSNPNAVNIQRGVNIRRGTTIQRN